MGERYWEANNIPATDVLLDWVNENVLCSLKEFWEANRHVAWIEMENDRIIFTVPGPGRPTEDDPLGERDIYALSFDLLETMSESLDSLTSSSLRSLAESILDLADKKDQSKQSSL